MQRAMPSRTAWLFFLLLQVARHHASDDVTMGCVCTAYGIIDHICGASRVSPCRARDDQSRLGPRSSSSVERMMAVVCPALPHKKTDLEVSSQQQQQKSGTVITLASSASSSSHLLEACGGGLASCVMVAYVITSGFDPAPSRQAALAAPPPRSDVWGAVPLSLVRDQILVGHVISTAPPGPMYVVPCGVLRRVGDVWGMRGRRVGDAWVMRGRRVGDSMEVAAQVCRLGSSW